MERRERAADAECTRDLLAPDRGTVARRDHLVRRPAHRIGEHAQDVKAVLQVVGGGHRLTLAMTRLAEPYGLV
jgi:hypothetical protein